MKKEGSEQLCQMFLKWIYQCMVSGELNKRNLIESA